MCVALPLYSRTQHEIIVYTLFFILVSGLWEIFSRQVEFPMEKCIGSWQTGHTLSGQIRFRLWFKNPVDLSNPNFFAILPGMDIMFELTDDGRR
jgi:hypothetical protein